MPVPLHPDMCPFGKSYCDNCSYYVGGMIHCNYDRRNDAICANANTEQQIYESRYKELMNLSKETLVEMIIGPNKYHTISLTIK